MPFWQLAQSQGKIAALSIIGKQPTYKLVPFIWIDLFKKHITFCGDPTIKPDETITRGKVKSNNYVSYFFKDKFVVGVLNGGSQNVALQFLELFQRGIKITYADVKENEEDVWETYFL
uniref:Uncharacterized protein n=1 Tax=Acrobeloides nanus TaxID=290746 RepID=A0A914CNJ6_9BILA